MQIENKTVKIKILRPDNPENWLTDGEIYSQEVYPGKEDSPGKWKEVTQEEYEKAMAEREQAQAEEPTEE